LVADVPDQPVFRGIENGMKRHRELDHTEAGAEVPARDGHGIDGLGPKLVSDLPELVVLQFSKVGGGGEGVEKRGRRSHYWNTFARFMLGDNAIPGLRLQMQRAITKSKKSYH
jgi:hypothetical protein